MGHRANGAVPQRTRLRVRAALACAASIAGLVASPVAHAALPSFTVYATQRTVRTSLHLQPGFALIVRADRRIDAVAVGDPRMVAAAPVRRGSDVFDVVLQPLSDIGATNMVLWFGDITTVWNLEIGPGLRTADVVFVVTTARPTEATAPRTATPHDPANAAVGPTVTAAPRTATGTTGSSPSVTGTPGPAAAPVPPTATAGATLELRETAGPVTAVFRARRSPAGVTVRYEITNGADTDLLIKPAAVLVRADGRPVAYGMARESVDRGRPDVIPRGATEMGAIDVAVPSARRLELVLSLVTTAPSAPPAESPPEAPAARSGATPSAPAPIVLEATFSGLDRLPVTASP